VFCRTPLAAAPAPRAAELLAYLAERLPAAATRRGAFGRGELRSLAIELEGARYAARRRGERLVLEPPAAVDDWLVLLLDRLRAGAAADHELRAALSRAGWSLQR
jgi:hypothetical protein